MLRAKDSEVNMSKFMLKKKKKKEQKLPLSKMETLLLLNFCYWLKKEMT